MVGLRLSGFVQILETMRQMQAIHFFKLLKSHFLFIDKLIFFVAIEAIIKLLVPRKISKNLSLF
jgi:hypothetical protein